MITLGKKARENENKRYAAQGLALGDKHHVVIGLSKEGVQGLELLTVVDKPGG